jgi:hypothetical protein
MEELHGDEIFTLTDEEVKKDVYRLQPVCLSV